MPNHSTPNHPDPPLKCTASKPEWHTREVMEAEGSIAGDNGGAGAAAARVCVIGGTGYIGSWLVKKLLERGYTVHATVRDLGNEAKVGLLRGLPTAAGRLRLFEGDFYNAAAFEPAILGCEFVFLVATPLAHDPSFGKFNNTTEAALDCVRTVMAQCQRAGTVRRLIYTGSASAASPLKDSSVPASYPEYIDESCWSEPWYPLRNTNDFVRDYVPSKTIAEKELMSYNDEKGGKVEVVSLVCGLVGCKDAAIPSIPGSIAMAVSPVTGNEHDLILLRADQEILGSNPVVHLDDVCDAHIFCMERQSMTGRYFCCAAWPSMEDLVEIFAKKYPQYNVTDQIEGKGVRVQPRGDKLGELGFKYKYGVEEIVDDCVECAKRFGLLQ